MVRKRGLRTGLVMVVVLLLASSAAAIKTAGTWDPTSETEWASGTQDAEAEPEPEPEPEPTSEPEPEPEPTCDERLHDSYEHIQSWYAEAESAWRAFLTRQQEEARDLSERDAPDDEWREADERWSAEAEALHARTVELFRQRAWDHLGACADRLGDPHMLWTSQWSGDRWGGWSAGSGEDAPAPYAPPPEPPEHPRAGDPAWRALEAEAARLQAACRERVEALRAEAEADGGGHDLVFQAERDCALQLRLLYEDYYQEQHREFGDSFGSLRMAWSEDEQRIVVTGRFLELRGDPDAATMEDLACRGPRYVDRIAADGFLAEFRPEETGSGTALRVFDDHGGRVFDLHDNERCTLNLATTDAVPWVTLDLADRLDCARARDGGVDCREGDVRVVVLVHDGAADLLDGNELVVRGRATFLVSKAQADAEPERAAYEDAVLDKRVGAEVQIGRSGGKLAVASAPIGDMEVRVTGGIDGIDVFVESAQGEGKTLWLAVDEALLRSALPSIEAYAVEPDGETRIEVRMAESMDDVLDPLDDGEAVEYWFSEQDGASVVLVSIPHFSEKRIHISPDLLGSVGIPAPGLAWLLLGLGVAAVVAGRRRA